MTDTITITREDFLAMTPQTILKDGFREAQGRLRDEVMTIWATAGAIQLETVSSAELVTTARALAQVMPLHDQGTASERFGGAAEEAQDLAGRIHGRTPTADLGRWLAATPFTRYLDVSFLAVDEIQIAADLERGHVFTDRILNRRGRDETMLLGAATMRPII